MASGLLYSLMTAHFSLSINMVINLVSTRLHATQLLLLITLTILLYAPTPSCSATTTTTTHLELPTGFKATPDPSIPSFQALLSDPNGNFSLGFLRVNETLLALAVLHVSSSEALWLANPASPARWSDHTQLIFNGSLVLSDPQTRVFWSTNTQDANRVVLLNTSNLQIQKQEEQNKPPSILWQSFDFPTNTLVENQNFTSTMALVSSNGLYSMRLGSDFMGLYATFKQGSEKIYWRRKAMEAKAEIVEGKGPIYARVNSDGYLGMYQTGNEIPVDVQPFSSFQRPGFIRVRLEPDGNLNGYYWEGFKWVSDFEAISAPCKLPSSCGSYGLCNAGNGSCSCLDNQTEFRSGECFPVQSGDFCSGGVVGQNDFWVLRRKGVELPYKELMGYKPTSSVEECERLCEKNCSCWGAVYNKASGFCYMVDYPIQTLVGVGDETKMGYFKVRQGAGRKKISVGFGVGIGVMCGAFVILIGIVASWRFRVWRRKSKRFMGQESAVSPGPYKDLGSASFRSIEMGNT